MGRMGQPLHRNATGNQGVLQENSRLSWIKPRRRLARDQRAAPQACTDAIFTISGRPNHPSPSFRAGTTQLVALHLAGPEDRRACDAARACRGLQQSPAAGAGRPVIHQAAADTFVEMSLRQQWNPKCPSAETSQISPSSKCNLRTRHSYILLPAIPARTTDNLSPVISTKTARVWLFDFIPCPSNPPFGDPNGKRPSYCVS